MRRRRSKLTWTQADARVALGWDNRRAGRFKCLFRKILIFLVPLYCVAQPTIATDHTDNSRLATVQETILTPTNVASKFGRLATIPLTGKPYSQVLYVPAIVVGGSTRNVIFAGDSANNVYAYDADTFASLWTTSALDTPCTTNCTSFGYGLNYGDPVGIFSTPGIDVSNGWIFVVTYSQSQLYKLWKLNLLTGATVGSSVTITGSVSPSTASDASGGTLTFNPALVQQRTGVTVANGNVYVTFGSLRDIAPWHGWIFGYSESAVSKIGTFCTNWNQNGGGIWQAGSGPAVLPNGNLIVVTGNGGTDSGTWTSSYDGITEFSMSVMQLSPTLTLVDWYTPADYAAQNLVDTDIGSSHPMLIPNPASAGNYLIVLGGKNYKVYSIHSECMGHLGGTVGGCPGAQVFATGTDTGQHVGIYGDAFMNNIAYFSNTNGLLYSFVLNNTGLFTTTPTTGSTTAFPGAMLSGSINVASNGILWATTPDYSTIVNSSSGELVALDPVTLSPIWTSATSAADALVDPNKFLSPTVAHGKVYVPTYLNTIGVYGLGAPGIVTGGAVASGGKFTRN